MAEDQGRFWLTAVEPELPPLGCGEIFLLSKHAKTMGAWFYTMRYSTGEGDTCTTRPTRFLKPVSRPVSIVFLGEDFIRSWPWRSELPGCSMVLKSRLPDRSRAPSKRAPACISARPASAWGRAFISTGLSSGGLGLGGG